MSNCRREPGAPGRLRGDVVQALTKGGFVRISQRGSHVKMRTATRVAIVPMHQELAQGTLSSILRQAGLTREEFIGLL